MKRWVNIISNGIFLIITIVLSYQIFIAYKKNRSLEGVLLPQASLLKISPLKTKKILLSQQIQPPFIILFWNINCPPCILEMKRYTSAILNHEIPAQRFIPINIGNNLKEVKKYIKIHNISYSLYMDQENKLASFFKLHATPLVVHINKQHRVTWISTGISPLGIIRAKHLFSQLSNDRNYSH